MSYEQLCLAMRRERKVAVADLVSAFRAIDTNGDGYISTEELLRMLSKVEY